MGFFDGFVQLFAVPLVGFYAVVKSYGFAIVLLTLAVRVLLLPLSIKQTRSMREMQRIQPEVKKLQAKNKGNRQKMNEELMALYKEHGVNPFGGCGPLVLQMPVLFGLFYVIRQPLKYMGYKAVEIAGGMVEFSPESVSGFIGRLQDSALANELFRNPLEVHSFLGLRLDCSSSAALNGDGTQILQQVCGNGVLSALPYLLLVLLMGGTTYYQQKQMQATQSAQGSNPQMQQMQMLTKFMPAMLMVFAFNFPTGVVIYWLTTNVWTIVQQRIILRAVPAAPAAKQPPSVGPAGGHGASGNGARKAKSTPPGTRSGEALKKQPPKKNAVRGNGPQAKKPAAAAAASKARPAGKKKRKR